MDYTDFLKTKARLRVESGFVVTPDELNNHLFPFQKYCVSKALKAGRFAFFQDCGMGKTIEQLVWAGEVSKRTQRPVLILAPLAVTGQTIKEGEKFGIKVAKASFDINHPHFASIQIANYEQIKNIDCSIFAGIVLDESSILKNFSGAYRNLIIETFANTPYKLACTATPSPNDELEIGNHAEFLNIMTSQDMRAIFFTTDKEIIAGNKYRLKKHAENDFYAWIAQWAIMISKPQDLGFEMEGYTLPPLNLIEKQIVTDKRDNGMLFNDVAVSATDFNGELKITVFKRLESVVEIVKNSDESFIIWIKHIEEGSLLKKAVPGSIEVAGSDKSEYKENKLLGFANNEFRVLITKMKIASFGLNYQNCHNMVFAAPDFSFEQIYQAIRRELRFGQLHTVNVWIITTDTMSNVIKSFNDKQIKFIKLQQGIIKNMKQNNPELLAIQNKQINEVETDYYKLYNGDCVEVTRSMEDNSIDYTFFSPPFGALYVFSNDPQDMSNVSDNDEFLQHFEFLVIELLRVTKPGRLVTIHMMQSTTLLGRDGYYSIKDFRGDLIRLFQRVGFYFHEEHMIRKDPKTAAIRTKNRQLMHGTTKKDSTIVRPGLADYMLTFKKPGENEVPVRNNIPFDLWCKIAEPVWIDIEESDTLKFRAAKDDKDERHITATQLTPIRWCYMMYVNKGEVVYSPFHGVASEGYEAIKFDCFFKGAELKKSYFDLSIKNCNQAISEKNQLVMFENEVA